MYQSAASSKSHSSTANVLEESEMCSVPGGLARMKKHFEKSDIASSHSSVTQYQYQHKSVKETRRSNEVAFMSSTKATEQQASQAEAQFLAADTEQVSVHKQRTHETSRASNYNQEADGVDVPKISTQVLKEQFEKSLKEKGMIASGNSITQAKHAKICNEYPEFEWPVVHTNLSGSANRVHDSITTSTEQASTSVNAVSANFGSLEEFPPPPPPDILEASELADFSQSPEPVSSTERHASKDVYSKQRNLYELKRLYKHIHPDVRKNLQNEYFNEVSDIVAHQSEQDGVISGDVQQAKYAFENSMGIPQKCISPEREYLEWDEILKGEVQSMRWIFENQPLDSIKDESPEPSHIKRIGEQEIIAGGDVKYTTWMFETQPIHALSVDSSSISENDDKVPDLARGDVRTATWLFETQPLDALNKIYKDEDTSEITNAAEDIKGGDVKTRRYLFETQNHDGQFCSVDKINMMQLRSELQEFKGDVKRTVKRFETEPKYVLKDSSGNIHEIKTVCREDIEKGDVKTALWMFETQPLDTINQDEVQVKVVQGISMEETIKGGVGKAKWLFETCPLDTINEQERSITEKEAIIGSDVYQKCWIFETLPMDMLKDNANEKPLQGEEIIGGNVSNTKYLFESVPMDEIKENTEVGKLKQVVTMDEEKGDVRHQRWVFETKPLEQIREEKKEYIRTVHLDEIHKGDVNSCKNAFETRDLTKHDFTHKIQIEDIDKGTVNLNKKLFETTPLYAIQDRFGHYHEVQTIRKEEVVKGDVRTCQWMFETIPIDQFGESVENYQIIKGISSQEIQSGDVKTGKWLFETQPLDSIKYFSNAEDEEAIREERTDVVKGDVKMCKWLFETQPMEELYDKEVKVATDVDIQRGDVKTCTWLFETQPLDSIQDGSEKENTFQTVDQEIIHGRDVQKVCFLFETQNLENIQGEEKRDFKRVIEIDVHSGDVSTMKYIFENQPLDKISSSSEEVLKKINTLNTEDLQKGNVLNCRWLFENRSIDEINEDQDKNKSAYAITDVQGGNVRKGCFIFETFSLDQIKDEYSEVSVTKTFGEDEIIKGDVKNYTMMFETQPLYAIQDKEGFYHEVTTVKKEEVCQGNVRGTRWLFETKPLDSFNDSNEVFIIKAVTQEDIQKGDVNSVRWRFETQSLDTISDDIRTQIRTVENVQGGNVKANKQLFETGDDNNKFVRTVSISEIQHGNVKTSTWLFETHTIDEIHGEGFQNIKTVTMEDIHKGDVQEAVWLFENQNLDSIREDEENVKSLTKELIPQADVRTTTWLFETTPLHEFNEHTIERQEIIGKSIQDTLKELYSHKIVESHGIILEADEIGDVRMAKYQLMNQETPEIQKEEIIRGDLQNIMMNLLSQNSSTERMVLLSNEEKGHVSLTKSQLLNRSVDVHVQKEDIVGGDVQEAIKSLLNSENCAKQGILIQESEKGDIKMTIYSLLNKKDGCDIQRDEIMGGDIKRTIYNLKSSAIDNKTLEKVKIEDSERGNVQFYTTCIESGALDYLKRLQDSSNEVDFQKETEDIIGGDVEGTKLLLKRQQFQIERTVEENDIIPGDVYNTVKIFMMEPENKSFDVNKEEIVKGNLRATLNSLTQAINQSVVVEKEEIIKADLPATLKSLTESQYQVRETEKPDVIPGDIQGTIDSLEKAVNMKAQFVKEEVIHGNLEATLKSLEEAQQSVKQVEKENIIRGDIESTVKNLLDASAEKKNVQHQISVQGDVKSTMQTLLQPPSPTIQRRASVEGNVENTIKHFLQSKEEIQSEHEMMTKRGISVGKLISVGQDDQPHTIKTDFRNQQSINTLQQNYIEKYDDLVHNVILRNDGKEVNEVSCQNVDSRAIHSVDENNLKMKKSGKIQAWKKNSTFSGVQDGELISGDKRCLLQGVSEGHKEKIQTDLINQNKAKLSTSINNSRFTESQQAINMINGRRSQVSDHAQTEVTNQQTKYAQHSRKSIAANEVNLQQAQVLDSINNNVENAEKVQMSEDKIFVAKETSKVENINLTKKKCMEEVRVKSKVGSLKGKDQFLVKTHLDRTKMEKHREIPEMNLPSPPLPLTQTSATHVPFPPPPPPPPPPFPTPNMSLLKANIEPENFPSPPPPVVDKMDSDILPPSETPPPFTTYKEIVKNKANTQPYHDQLVSRSEKSETHTKKHSIKQSGIALSQKHIKTEHATNYTEQQKSDMSQKSKLPVFQPKVKNMTVSHASKQTTASEYAQKVDTSQSFSKNVEQQGCDQEFEISQRTLPSKKKVCFTPVIPQSSTSETLVIKPNAVHQTVIQANESKCSSKEATISEEEQKESGSQLSAQDFEQLICDQELERIHEETLKTQKVFFSPRISPALKTRTPPTKSQTGDISVTHVNESKIASTEARTLMYTQNKHNSELSVQDTDQFICDHELEKNNEDNLKPKKKVFFPPRISPALQTETPPPKPKTYVRKFKTPLMIAEEKYRQQREELEKNKAKASSHIMESAASESETVHTTTGSEVIISVLGESQKTAEKTIGDLNHVKVSVQPVNTGEFTIASMELQQLSDLSKQRSTHPVKVSDPNYLPKGEISSSRLSQTNQEGSVKVFQEYKTLEKISGHSDKLNQFHQANTRTISPKPEFKPLNENIQNKNKFEKCVKQESNNETMKQTENTALLMKQNIAEKSHRMHFTENNISQKINTQLMLQSTQQHELDNSVNSPILSNEIETETSQSKLRSMSGIKSEESTRQTSPRKEQVKKDQANIHGIVKQSTYGSHSVSEKPNSFPGHQVQHIPLPKELMQENKTTAQSIVKDRQKHETTRKKEITEKNKQVLLSHESLSKEEINSMDVIECLRKCEELQQMVSNLKKFESEPHTLSINAFRTFLNTAPTWFINEEKKKEIADVATLSNTEFIKGQISYIIHHALDMQSSFESNIHLATKSSTAIKNKNESSTLSGMSQKQISAISKKVEKRSQEKTKVNNEMVSVSSGLRQTDIRACSPSLKMRSPSPTYITIESTARRTNSPHKEKPQYASTLQKEQTTVPSPPRRSVTPKMTSPSLGSQKSRSEQLAKLKDTTAKLSHGTMQPRAITPVPVVLDKKCEIIHSPATLRRQLKIESHATECLSTTPIPANEVTVSKLEGRTEIYEETRKSQVHKTHTQQEQKHIPEWLAPDMDVITVTQKTDVPKSHTFEAKDKKVYTRKEANSSENLKHKNKDDISKADDMETANSHFITNKGKFQSGINKTVHHENDKSVTEVPENNCTSHDAMKGKLRYVPIRQIKGHKENASKQMFVNRHLESKEQVLKPMLHPERISMGEHITGVDNVESKMGRSRISHNSENVKSGFEFKHAPPTYEDVISGHILDISSAESPDEILKNFQKTWEESERVFKSLGYTVSDTSEMRSSYHQEEYISENSASGQGSLHCLSKESLSNGMPGSRQADLS
ncbi:xin actin-binding repeat-containing protein 2 [Rhinophrynus dorsalis]